MKKIVSIGNILLGIVIGATISFSPQIYGASVTLLGKDVDKQMEVKLNDKVIGQAAVIEGTSYLPVRALANEFQLEVAVDKTTITLTSPSAEENAKLAQEQQAIADKEQKELVTNATKDKLNRDITSSKRKLESYAKALTFLESDIIRTKGMLDTITANSQAPEASISEAQKKYNSSVTAKDSMQKNIDDEKAVLADLESQLSALQ